MIDLDTISIVLRWLIYVSTVSAAGGVLFRLAFPAAAAHTGRTLAVQIRLGSLAVLIIETLRFAVFQLEAAGGNWTHAFGSELRFMGFGTAFGQAAALRVAAALVVLAGLRRGTLITACGAALMMGSYALEGHTASEGRNLVLTLLLLIHITAVHGWIGALPSLLHLCRHAEPPLLRETIASFGRRAARIVAGLAAAGVLLAGLLTGGMIDAASPYQQHLGLKLLLVAALLGFAAWNKFRLTPRLMSQNIIQTRAELAGSIKFEICFAAGVFFATAKMLAHAPMAD